MDLASLIENMKMGPFSLLIGGSNDTGLEKLNLLTVKIFDAPTKTNLA